MNYKIKELLGKDFWWQYLISGIIVTVGAWIIHMKDYSPPEPLMFFLWIPAAWVLLFIFALIFGFLIGEKENLKL